MTRIKSGSTDSDVIVVGTYIFLFPQAEPQHTNGGWCVHDAAGMHARAGKDGEDGKSG